MMGTKSARILLSTYIPYGDIVAILIHEIVHVLSNWKDGHGKLFQRKAVKIHKMYINWTNNQMSLQ